MPDTPSTTPAANITNDLVRTDGPPSSTIITTTQHGTYIQPNNAPPDSRPPPTPYYTVARLLGFLPTLHLDELAQDKKDCPVCAEPFSLDDRPTLLRCNHLLGRMCVEKWILTGKNSCPMCREAVFRRVSS